MKDKIKRISFEFPDLLFKEAAPEQKEITAYTRDEKIRKALRKLR